MKEFFKHLISDEEGATMVEYALMVGLIAIVVIAGATLLGTNINSKLNSAATSVSSAGGT
ncbi:Flp family type IVb pilin [Singulisphaera rosea]